MAARWGAGEETLTIGGMELFTAGGPLQCHDMEEDETCDGLSDLALSSLDAGGILGTFQGYIDNSIISIIDDHGAQAEHKDPFNEENELSLLTALTEILDNADDENMSPFDTIPDTELLVSSKDREGSAKFLALSRTPPDHEMFSVEGQRRVNSSKIGAYSGPNWELFPDTISSTPKRPNRHKSTRGCLPRRAEAEEIHQRSDGEDEEVPSPGEVNDKKTSLAALDKNFSIDTGADIEDVDHLMQGTPCIINTENVALNDLVKYMHPYCLPAITMCLESEDEENLLNEEVFLEIVSDQGECIKVPVVVEPPMDMLCESSDGMEGMDDYIENIPIHLSSSEPEVVKELEANQEEEIDCTEKSNDVQEPIEGAVSKLQDLSPQPPDTDMKVKCSDGANTSNVEEAVQCCKSSETEITVSVIKEKVPLKGKKSSKKKQPPKTKSKSKVKSVPEDKSPDSPVTGQSISQPPVSRPSNLSLQESDFLIKTLDQVKRESLMELRSAKIGRTKPRSRASLESSLPEKKSKDLKVKPVPKESEPAKSSVQVVAEREHIEHDLNVENPKCEETADSAAKIEGLQSDKDDDDKGVIDVCGGDETSSNEESGVLKVEDGDNSQLMKEAKPKSLSLSEYRKRLQYRKPNPDKNNENPSCSKWPSVPEPPKELAELPCLVIPTQSNKPSLPEKACPPNKAIHVSGQDVPVSSAPAPTIATALPVTSQDVQPLNEKSCPTIMDVASPPMITPQPNVPPPFYPPAWPAVPPHPSFYHGMPPLPAVPHFPNGMPPVMPIQPPPVMSWPPFPPPPIAVPPVHPTGWVSGPQAPYWPNAQMAPGMPESQPYHNTLETSGHHAFAEQKMLPEVVVPPAEYRPQTAVLPIVQTNRTPVLKSMETSVGPKVHKTAAKPESVKPKSTHNGHQVRPALKAVESSLSMKAVNTPQNAPSLDLKAANVPIADLKSANQVVFKIMEILKKAQKLGFQIKPPSDATIAKTKQEVQVSPSTSALKPEQPKQMQPADGKGQMSVPPTVVEKSSILVTPRTAVIHPSVAEKISAAGNGIAQKVAEDKLASPCKVSTQEAKESIHVETLCTSLESCQTLAEPDLKEPEKNFNCESGIEASDLTSLLEQFEQSEVKEEERLPQSPDKLAVGNSGTEKTLEKKIHDKQLPPELANTAGLTPPATPPHQLWKSVVPGPLSAKTKSLNGQEKTCSPLKTAKLIEPKPLPQNRLKNRNISTTPSVASPPIHVASGDHDYCILSNQRSENAVPPAATPLPSQCEEGSRWNVKHHQNITIKPIVQFNKRQQNKACPKQPPPSAPSHVANQSATCGPTKPDAPCESIQNVSNDPLDHRTNVMAQSAPATSPPGSVLMSPDSSPCRSDNGESRTDVKSGSTSASRRSMRCYRKYRGSPSPQKSWRGRSSGSRSDSRSSSSYSSSSRSRSGSPASKRRRISRYQSRSRHRSRSSSRSSYGSSSSSRSSSRSSWSCSQSSSRSRSRSRSPYRGRHRSRRCESRESYNRRKMFHKERAIEERRVVYIGKINSQMTRSELRRRFSIFGEIEECTIHFRQEGDNYGFVTYRCTREAFAAIENGHKVRLPDELPFDLCFGGRRQFCKSNYADLDSNRDDFDPAPVRSKFDNLDFDTLLRQAQKSHRR